MNRYEITLTMVRNFIWILDSAIFLVFFVLRPSSFGTLNNIHYILYYSSVLGFGVIAEAIALISGNFDLSVGENIGFSAMLTAVILKSFNSPSPLVGVIGIVLVLLISTGLGLINGILVGFLNLNAFLATLGTYLLFFWGTLAIRSTVVYGLPEVFLFLGGGKIGGVWASIFIFFVVIAFFHFILRYTRFGIKLYAVGVDKRSSHMLGLNVNRITFYAYLLAGFFAGLAALMYVGLVGCVPPQLADGTIFDFFAGAVLGGVSIRGGQGTLMGVFGGILFMGITRSGLIMLGIDPNVVGLLSGFLILVAIIIDMLRNKALEKMLSRRQP